jgi:hypothetical protein
MKSHAEVRAAGTLGQIHDIQKQLSAEDLSRLERDEALRTLTAIQAAALKELDELKRMLRATDELREDIAVQTKTATLILSECCRTSKSKFS